MKFFVVTMAFILHSAVSSAQMRSCGEVKQVKGTQCSALNVQFDLSQCGDAQTNSARVICRASGTTAEVRTNKNTFRVALENSGGKWQVAGKVWQFPKQESKSTRAVAAATTEPGTEGDGLALPVVATKPLSLDSKLNVPEDAYAPDGEVKSKEPKQKSLSEAQSEPASIAGFKLSAFIDVYYGQNMNGAAPAQHTGNPATIPNANTNLRYYDQYSDQIQISLAELTVKKETSKMGLLLDLDFGTSADINGANPPYSASTTTSEIRTDEMSKHIGQAVVSFKPVKGLLLEAGKMATHVGLETMKSKDNWNYSRSTLYTYGLPLWHSGAHVGFEVVPNAAWLGTYVYNGWNSMYENNHSKSLGAQLKITDGQLFTFVANYLGGPEKNLDNVNRRQIYEANLTLNLPNQMSLQGDWLEGREEHVLDATTSEYRSVTWKSYTCALKWAPIAEFSLSPRYEVYEDVDGYTFGGYDQVGFAQTLTSWTVTGAFTVADQTELRLEWRQDQSSKADRFTKSNFETTNEQVTYTAALLSSF